MVAFLQRSAECGRLSVARREVSEGSDGKRRKAVMRKHRFSLWDWNGDAVLMLAAGVAGVIAVFLPWANDYTADFVNFSLSRPDGVGGVLQTQWGAPVLVAALVAIAVAAAMLIAGPRLLTMIVSLLGTVAGIVFVLQAMGAADSMVKLYRPGLGLYITLLTGILLVPIGVASTIVGQILRRKGAATAPPGP
jgi:hypothetical protein